MLCRPTSFNKRLRLASGGLVNLKGSYGTRTQVRQHHAPRYYPLLYTGLPCLSDNANCVIRQRRMSRAISPPASLLPLSLPCILFLQSTSSSVVSSSVSLTSSFSSCSSFSSSSSLSFCQLLLVVSFFCFCTLSTPPPFGSIPPFCCPPPLPGSLRRSLLLYLLFPAP